MLDRFYCIFWKKLEISTWKDHRRNVLRF